MADKKTSKPVDKKATKTVVNTVKDLRLKTQQELTDLLLDAHKDLAGSRRSLAAGELVNPRVISIYRKDIARLKTLLIEKAREETRKEDA